MAKMNELQRQSVARFAFSYEASTVGGYSKDRKNEPCCYGKLVKYLMGVRGFSFGTFAAEIGISPQALNHRLNIQKKKNWRNDEIELYCGILGIERDDFMAISEMIFEMESKK